MMFDLKGGRGGAGFHGLAVVVLKASDEGETE